MRKRGSPLLMTKSRGSGRVSAKFIEEDDEVLLEVEGQAMDFPDVEREVMHDEMEISTNNNSSLLSHAVSKPTTSQRAKGMDSSNVNFVDAGEVTVRSKLDEETREQDRADMMRFVEL